MDFSLPQLIDYQIIGSKIKFNVKKGNTTLPCLLNLWDISEIFPNFASTAWYQHDGITIIYKMDEKTFTYEKRLEYICTQEQAEKLTNEVLKFPDGILPNKFNFYDTINNTHEESIIEDNVNELISNLTSNNNNSNTNYWNIGSYTFPDYNCSSCKLTSNVCISDEETESDMFDVESISGYSSEVELYDLVNDPFKNNNNYQQNIKNSHHMITRSKAKLKIDTVHLDFDDTVKHYE